MASGSICGARRGRYTSPVSIPKSNLKFVDEDNGHKEVKAPKTIRCDDRYHEGRKKRFPTEEMYVQFWRLTDEEKKEAIEEYDMMSIGIEPRIICVTCAKKLWKKG